MSKREIRHRLVNGISARSPEAAKAVRESVMPGKETPSLAQLLFLALEYGVAAEGNALASSPKGDQ